MAVEFRGCKNLVIAEVLEDNAAGYVTGEVMPLAPVAEISKSVETSSEAHYYDNIAAIVINSEGADTVAFTIAVPNDETYALITGRTYDERKHMFIESPRAQKYFAVGYTLGEVGEGEDERYVWRLKGTFNIPEETSATVNDGTDANNLSLEFTGVYTTHVFSNGKGTGNAATAKALFVRHSSNPYGSAENFFAHVVTPDTVAPTIYTLSINEAEGTTVTVLRGGNVLSDGATLERGDVLTISVEGGTLIVNGAPFVSGGTHTVAGDVNVGSAATPVE